VTGDAMSDSAADAAVLDARSIARLRSIRPMSNVFHKTYIWMSLRARPTAELRLIRTCQRQRGAMCTPSVPALTKQQALTRMRNVCGDAQSLDLIIPERFRAAHWRGFDAAVKTGVTNLRGRPTLTQAMHQTGRKLYVELTFALIAPQAGGPAYGAVAVARDVTDRVERQKAEAARNG